MDEHKCELCKNSDKVDNKTFCHFISTYAPFKTVKDCNNFEPKTHEEPDVVNDCNQTLCVWYDPTEKPCSKKDICSEFENVESTKLKSEAKTTEEKVVNDCPNTDCSNYLTNSTCNLKHICKFYEHKIGYNKFIEKAIEIGQIVTEKNKAYGDSFAKTADFLNLLYPNGIKPEDYGNALALVRIFDKMMRIATDKDAFGENPFSDIGGYAILSCVNQSK